MCRYNYIYHSACQHGEFTRLTSCLDTTSLGASHFDDLSPDSARAGTPPGDRFHPSSSHQPATSAKNSSFPSSHSQPHNQPHYHSNMSTLHLSGVERPYGQRADAVGREVQERGADLAFTPRSALNDGMLVHDTHTLSSASIGNLNIDLPLYSRATLSMEIVRDEHEHVPSKITRRLSGSDAGTTRGLPQEFREARADSHAAGHTGQTSHSPRKSLPSHWLPKSNGPNLATAQRAKERSHKKDSHNGSPIDVKTLRGARSSIDFSKSNGVESPTYLTKEALAAVENDIASPTSAHGPYKLPCSPPKPSWRSPTASPLRSSPSQHINANAKMSPTRAGLLNVGARSVGHSRAPSSVAASCGTFHTANESPVRSPSGTELSFQSASENFEDTEIPNLKPDTDIDVLQPSRHLNSASPVKQKFATVGKAASTKPRLALHIPVTSSIVDHETNPVLAATKNLSSTNPDSSDAEIPRTVSRIPRVAGSVRSGSAYGATRSSTLKQAQSVRSLAAKSTLQQSPSDEPHRIPLPETPAHPALRHVRTVDSSGATPILSRHTVQGDACPTYSLAEIQSAYNASGVNALEHLEQRCSNSTSATSVSPQDSICFPNYSGTEQSSRATSVATVKASPLLRDPVPTDSAIIYSRKKGGDLSAILGMGTHSPNLEPQMTTVMMSQLPDLIAGVGKLHVREATETFESEVPTHVSSTASSIRGRTDRYVPAIRIQTESQDSLQSSCGSELRATAPDFVPQPTSFESAQPSAFEPAPPTSTEQAETVPTDASVQQQFQPAPWFPLDMSGLDKHGIPWFYYMYPVQFAYDQGFRNGRSRSPRKCKNKKQRQSMSAMNEATPSTPGLNLPCANVASAASTPANTGRRLTSGELMPPPPVPAHRRQQVATEHSLRGGNETTTREVDVVRSTQPSDGPFARQLDVIAQRDILCNNTNANRPRGRTTDLTTIHNVGLPHEYKKQPSTNYHTVSLRHGRYHHRHAGNGLYNGRGSSGVPMSATTPFPDPAPPQGRPPLGAGGTPAVIGTEACGMVDIRFAGELGGGWPCNSCAPDH